MSHSSGTAPAARRATSTVGLVAVVLLAVAGGLLVTATTSGAPWVDPPIEAPIAAPSESRPTSPTRTPRRSVVPTESPGVADTTVEWRPRVVATPVPAADDPPPPGRSPPTR